MGKETEIKRLEDKENVFLRPRKRAVNQPRVKANNQAGKRGVITPPQEAKEVDTITLSSDDEEENNVPSVSETGLGARNPSAISSIPQIIPEEPNPGPSRRDTSVPLPKVSRTPPVVSESSKGSSSSTEESEDEIEKELNDLCASSNKTYSFGSTEQSEDDQIDSESEQTLKLLMKAEEKIQDLEHVYYKNKRRIYVLECENTLYKKRNLNLEREKEQIEIEKCWFKRELKAKEEQLSTTQKNLAGSRNMGNKRKRSSGQASTQSAHVPGGEGTEASATGEQTAEEKVIQPNPATEKLESDNGKWRARVVKKLASNQSRPTQRH